MPTKKGNRPTKSLRKAKSLNQVKPLTTGAGKATLSDFPITKHIDHSNP